MNMKTWKRNGWSMPILQTGTIILLEYMFYLWPAMNNMTTSSANNLKGNLKIKHFFSFLFILE